MLIAEIPYWGETLIKVGGAIAAVTLIAMLFVYLLLFKMVSFMQSRLGPMEAGPYGSLQLLAEVGKFVQKEDLVPRRADRFLFTGSSRLRGVWVRGEMGGGLQNRGVLSPILREAPGGTRS